MTVSIDLLRNDNFRVVDNPELASVESAIGGLVDDAVQAGHEASSSGVYEFEEAHSTNQALTNLGFTAEYLGGSAAGDLSVEKQGKQNTIMAYFIQRAFTVTMQQPYLPGDVVSEDFSHDRLDELVARGEIGPNNPPLYISAVTYGRIMMYQMTSTESVEKMKAAANFSYTDAASVSGYGKDELETTLSKSSFKVAAFGGNAKNIEAMIKSGKLANYFTVDTKLTSMTPISFEIKNLSDFSIAEISRTTEYDVKKCKFVGKTTPPIGEKIKVTLEKVYIPDDCDDFKSGNIYGEFKLNYYDPNTDSQFTSPIFYLPANQAVSVDSGDSLYFGDYPTKTSCLNREKNCEDEIDIYYDKDKPFGIDGLLLNEDDGKDDMVGAWVIGPNDGTIGPHIKIASLPSMGAGCDDPGKYATLFYTVERLEYLF